MPDKCYNFQTTSKGDLDMKKWTATVIRITFLAIFIVITIQGNMMLWLGFFLASLIAAVFFGRLYCGYACPMNTVMIPTEWLSKKLKIQNKNTPKWLTNGIFAWIFLVISIVVMIVSKKVLHKNIPLLLIWLVISALVTLRYKPMVFHNLICPFGALQKTFGRFAMFSKRVDSSTCIGCKKCEKVCPSEAIIVKEDNKAVITTNLCHQCTNCSEVCPTAAIKYSKR